LIYGLKMQSGFLAPKFNISWRNIASKRPHSLTHSGESTSLGVGPP
jgi:hypothetical protein